MTKLFTWIGCLAFLFLAQTQATKEHPQRLSGYMAASDPTQRILADHGDHDHIDTIILETRDSGFDHFVKVEVLAFRKDPLASNVFDGKHEIQLLATRSSRCDEEKPIFLKPDEDILTAAGKFMRTVAYENKDLALPHPLKCYTARTDKP